MAMEHDGEVGPPSDPNLIYGEGPKVLRTMHERRQAGASLADLRRDTAADATVSDRDLEACCEGGRWVAEQERYGAVRAKRRLYGGIDLPQRQD